MWAVKNADVATQALPRIDQGVFRRYVEWIERGAARALAARRECNARAGIVGCSSQSCRRFDSDGSIVGPIVNSGQCVQSTTSSRRSRRRWLRIVKGGDSLVLSTRLPTDVTVNELFVKADKFFGKIKHMTTGIRMIERSAGDKLVELGVSECGDICCRG
jgi:hypothetical protein